jgi:hypothetical protein
VELGPEVLAHPRHEDAEAYGVTTRLFNQIGGELVARGRASAAGETVVHVTVTGFRLRHDQLSYWVGSYAGADLLAVHVEASRGGEVVDRFDTSASSVLAGIASGSGNQRLDRVVKEVSRRVADGLASSEAEAAPADAEGPAGQARHAVQDERESLPTGPDDRGPWSGGLDPADP